MSNDKAICKLCDEGHLQPQMCKNNGIDLVYSVCDFCGSEQAAGDQLRANKRAMMKFKKKVDVLLVGEEVRADFT
jgi:HTH-type transcriptional regulator/antitoxin MqsA